MMKTQRKRTMTKRRMMKMEVTLSVNIH